MTGLTADRQGAAESANQAAGWPQISGQISTSREGPSWEGAEGEEIVVEVVIFLTLGRAGFGETRRARTRSVRRLEGRG